jgi:hypothetical protein
MLNYLLIFTGLRKEKNVETGTHSKSIINFIKRKTLTNKKEKIAGTDNDYSQPRNVTRQLYERTYNKSLSPVGTVRNHAIVEVPPIIGLENIRENQSLRNQFEIEEKKEIILSWLYTLFIFLILWIQPLYTLIHVINKNKSLTFHMPTLCFDFIYPIQYFFCLIYFSNDHFEKFYLEKEKDVNKKFPTTDTITIMSCFYAIIGLIFLFTGLFNSDELVFPGFHDFPLTSKIPILIILVMSWTIGRLTFFIHSSIFFLTFCKHCLILRKFIKQISKEKREDLISINDLSVKILDIRYELERSVDNFKNFLSTVTLLGAVSIGFLIEQIKINSYNGFPWVSFSFFLIFQIVFLSIIVKVDKYREDLVSYIRSGNFVKKYLSRYNNQEITDKFENNTELILLNFEEENSTTIDWLVVNNVLSEGWSQFTVLGVPISDGSLIKRGIALVTLIITFNEYFK